MGFGRDLPVKLVGWSLGGTVGVLDIDDRSDEHPYRAGSGDSRAWRHSLIGALDEDGDNGHARFRSDQANPRFEVLDLARP